MIAALFVQKNGSYFGVDGVDPWDEQRDARQYVGPWPVVAHPPCQRWGKMWFGQPLTVKLTGERKQLGDDGGCFKAALNAARTYGGVIEHPWGSLAWPHFDLNTPERAGGWIMADYNGGWTCCVEQGRYGHYARKPTLILAYGIDDLPSLEWGYRDPTFDPAVVARMGIKRAKRLGEVGARGGGWIGEFRPVWSAVYMTVGKPDQPEYFRTAEQAELSAWRALRNVEQPVMVRAGDRCQAAKSAAAKLFVGGGKVVEVERKAVRA